MAVSLGAYIFIDCNAQNSPHESVLTTPQSFSLMAKEKLMLNLFVMFLTSSLGERGVVIEEP